MGAKTDPIGICHFAKVQAIINPKLCNENFPIVPSSNAHWIILSKRFHASNPLSKTNTIPISSKIQALT